MHHLSHRVPDSLSVLLYSCVYYVAEQISEVGDNDSILTSPTIHLAIPTTPCMPFRQNSGNVVHASPAKETVVIQSLVTRSVIFRVPCG